MFTHAQCILRRGDETLLGPIIRIQEILYAIQLQSKSNPIQLSAEPICSSKWLKTVTLLIRKTKEKSKKTLALMKNNK